MTIKYNGQDLQKRIINGREVEKVMYNGVQIRPSSTPVSDDYLCFTSLEANNSLLLQIRRGSPTAVQLEISTDKSTWSDYTIGTNITLANIGDKIYWRNKSTTPTGFSTSNLDYYRFVTGKTFEVSGDVNYLLCKTSTTTLTSNYCFAHLFEWNLITTAPKLPATTLTDYCYFDMFYYCQALTTPPALPATTLATGCYSGMFIDCTSLTTPPALPATILADYCYGGMFSSCTSLTTAPNLPAADLATSCYNGMFLDCTSLTTAPNLPSINLADYCYSMMFFGCTSLIAAPNLPATALDYSCYAEMFSGCTSLEIAPNLPATNLADYCYNRMFSGCTSLVTIPELPATILPEGCYQGMFEDCINIRLSTIQTGEYTKAYMIPTTGGGTAGFNSLSDMFAGTGGTFTGTPSINTTYYLTDVDYLCFELYATSRFRLNSHGDVSPVNLEISRDKIHREDYTIGDTITPEQYGGIIYFRNKSATPTLFSGISGYYYFEGDYVDRITGDVNYLLCKYSTMSVSEYCFRNLFKDFDARVYVRLPATTVAQHCYESMFEGCRDPNISELPATTLAPYCYSYMFKDSGVDDIRLPATTLAPYCYQGMFLGGGLLTAPELPATRIDIGSYSSMFEEASILNPPQLPATYLSDYSYSRMFYDTDIVQLPELPAVALGDCCYEEMFKGCDSIYLSDIQGGDYQTAYRIPSSGIGTEGQNSLRGMFEGTGGYFTGTPNINQTYYTSNTVI